MGIREEAPWQDIICYFPNLKSFTSNLKSAFFFPRCRFSADLILKQIATFCPNIEEIDLCLCTISSKIVKYLCRKVNGEIFCKKLKKFTTLDVLIREDDVKCLVKNLRSLEIIDYSELSYVIYSLHENDLQSLDKVEPYNISTLNLNMQVLPTARLPLYNDIRKVCLSVCPYLKVLTCSLSEDDDRLDFFPRLIYLEKLDIIVPGQRINIDEFLNALPLCVKLADLTITNCTVSLSVLADSCVYVESLFLDDVDFCFDAHSKPEFNTLRFLTFRSCIFSKDLKAFFLFLSSLRKLEYLKFDGCNISLPEIKSQILNCCELNPIKKLYLHERGIQKDYLKDILLNCHTLEHLEVICLVDAYYTNVDGSEIKKFAKSLPNKPNIDYIHISDNFDFLDWIDDDEMEYEEILNR